MSQAILKSIFSSIMPLLFYCLSFLCIFTVVLHLPWDRAWAMCLSNLYLKLKRGEKPTKKSPSPPSQAAAEATGFPGTRRSSRSPLFFRGTGWLWEGWRALTRVPRPPLCHHSHFSVSAENNKHGAMVQSFLLLKNELEILLSYVLLLLPRCPWTENCRIKRTSLTPLWCSPLEKF